MEILGAPLGKSDTIRMYTWSTLGESGAQSVFQVCLVHQDLVFVFALPNFYFNSN